MASQTPESFVAHRFVCNGDVVFPTLTQSLRINVRSRPVELNYSRIMFANFASMKFQKVLRQRL